MTDRRSTTLVLSAVAAAAVLTLSACTGGSVGTGGSGSGSSGKTKTLELAFLQGISTPDPDTAYDGSELNLVNSAYEGLLGYRPGQAKPELTGVLATAWSANTENTVFTFTLRDDVTFHDGTKFDSSALKASFDRRTKIGEGPSYMTSGIASVQTPSATKAVITLKQPNSSFPDLLASPFGPKMISPTAIQKHPPKGETDWFDTNDAGTGPYTYDDFQPGTSYRLSAYSDYWGTKPGYKDVHFDVESNMSTIQLKLESGDLDGLIGYTDTASFATFQKDAKLASYTFPSMQTPTMFVNPKSGSLGNDAVRKSFVSGIDFRTLATAALGTTAKPTTEVFPANLLDPSRDQQVVTHDGEQLARLASGALKGRTVTIGYSQASPPAQALSDNLAAMLNGAGISAKSVGYAQGTYFPALGKGADGPDITFFTGFPDTAHPDAWARVFYTPDGGLDLFGASADGVEQLLDEALASGDASLYSQVSQKVSESAYWYSVASSQGTAVFQPDVSGVKGSYNPVITGVLDLAKLTPAK